MKKRKQTCSTKHIHCAKVSENLVFLPETIFYGINCCNRVLPREEPQEENFFPGIFWQHFLIRKSAKSGVWAKRSGNRLCQHSGHFLGILDTLRGPYGPIVALYRPIAVVSGPVGLRQLLSFSVKKKCLPKSTFYAALATCIISSFRNSLFPEESSI